jgi:hypothetical protein
VVDGGRGSSIPELLLRAHRADELLAPSPDGDPSPNELPRRDEEPPPKEEPLR